MPPAQDRIVRGTYIEAESLINRIWCEPAAAQVQSVGACSGGKQLQFTPYDQKAWIELPFDVPDDGRYLLKADIGRSRDCGTYDILLDGKKIAGPLNLHSAEYTVKTEKLGIHELKKGVHKLRFVCVGADPQSKIKGSGQPGYYIGIDGVSYRKLIPRK
jgi:hypothetical protein